MSEPEILLPSEACKCGKNKAQASHSCPYAEEIGDDDDPDYCTCCEECEIECCYAI